MTLYRETPCEHDLMYRHGVRNENLRWSDEECPGGSREEVTTLADVITVAEAVEFVRINLSGLSLKARTACRADLLSITEDRSTGETDPKPIDLLLALLDVLGINYARPYSPADTWSEALREVQTLVETARRVANPDLTAMLRILWEHFYDDMEGNPSDPDEAWEYNKEWSEVQMVGLPERLWAAALGLEDE